MDILIRPYEPDDLPTLRAITVDSFNGVTLEQNVENVLGKLNGHDWQWRKMRHIDADVDANPAGVFVAVTQEADPNIGMVERILGYITTRVDADAGQGWIPNLAVVQKARGQGLGRRLIEHALDYFRTQDLAYAVIETMAQNEIGQHLYPACGFTEVARQVHYARKL